MNKLLSRMSVKASMTFVLIFFTIFVLSVAGLGYISSKKGESVIAFLNKLNAEQLDAINRTRVNISDTQIAFQEYLNTSENTQQSRQILVESRESLTQADQYFTLYKATLKNASKELELEKSLVKAYERLTAEGLEAQQKALESQDFIAFRDYQKTVDQARSDFKLASQQFTNYTDEKSQLLMSDFAEFKSTSRAIQLGVIILAGILVLLVRLGIIHAIIRPLQEAVTHFELIAKGDLSQRISSHGRNEIGMLFSAMKAMQSGLSDTVSKVRSGSSSIYLGAREIATGNTDLSSRTEQQAASLEETAASMEQLTSTVKQNADNARQASTLANEASNTAERGGEVVGQVISTMEDISASSKQVVDIISVIDSIAFQTNILALNASVEAARAGEQGRGFAVVASEVRVLASRSADAAKEIRELIQASAAQIEEGSGLVTQAGSTMNEVVSAVRRVTDIMDEISAASLEQSSGIAQVNQAVAQMDEVTQQNSALVQEAASAAASLEDQAEQLEKAVAIFQLSEAQGTQVRPTPPIDYQAPSVPSLAPIRSTTKRASEKPKNAELEWEAF